MFLFSKLPEADQRAFLRQADDKEFERYVTHAHQKIRAQIRDERSAKRTEAPAPAPSSALDHNREAAGTIRSR